MVSRVCRNYKTLVHAGKEEHLKDRTDNMPLSARIASLQASQAKAGKLGVSLSTLSCSTETSNYSGLNVLFLDVSRELVDSHHTQTILRGENSSLQQ